MSTVFLGTKSNVMPYAYKELIVYRKRPILIKENLIQCDANHKEECVLFPKDISTLICADQQATTRLNDK